MNKIKKKDNRLVIEKDVEKIVTVKETVNVIDILKESYLQAMGPVGLVGDLRERFATSQQKPLIKEYVGPYSGFFVFLPPGNGEWSTAVLKWVIESCEKYNMYCQWENFGEGYFLKMVIR